MDGNPLQSIRIGTLVDGNSDDPARYIEEILNHGFESFQITFWKTIGETDLARLAERVRTVLEGTGATISALGIYGNPLESDEEAEENRRSWASVIAHAAEFGTDIVAGFAGRLRNVAIDQSIPRFVEVFEPLAASAVTHGLRLAFENCAMGGDWSHGDWNIAHGPDAWELMFDALPAENIGLEWEPCHQMVNLIDPLPQLRSWVTRVFHVHGKCCTVHRDVVERHGIRGSVPFAFHRTPGFGDCNWTHVISDLRAGGFEGAIDIEGWHDPVYRDQLEMTGQVHALNYLKECRGGAFVANPVENQVPG